MKIRIEDIPESGLSLDLSVEGVEIEKAAGGDLGFSFAVPVAARMEVRKAGADVSVTGDIKTRIKAKCSRCLKEMELPLEFPFYDFYVRAGAEEREKELKPEDMEVNFLEGPELNTTDIILAQLALEAPMQPLCSPDCKGLCATCGADLNEGPCGHEKAGKIDPRLTALKGFKAGGQGSKGG